ncbi:Uncharacterised protein [Mycobacteroides abscessus subsp. massiliense]|nr:hypothetical protein [Mycobacteroides abscessus]SKG96423.1 Uncharacterised protein [Mycobacteroides abscessus subsp. massiliense]SKH56291.1 Uncharacterised protein [Mycobacteroides abscessus subsp. massiliense]SKI08414.1 Uncharacterised protein [Mycobacteroides abscessus subsp. massiliense]SKJ39422.1 Uncharacterised protein [Mycobacteroides abscessus subsp. massiliense]SKJ83016.1 Uncharacterised protein [Mycobacteroides abscessus subsp. massiliense]
MRSTMFGSTFAALLVVGSLGTAGLAYATGDADTVINDLKSKGYRVVVTREGSGPQADCTVASVTQQSPVINQQVPRTSRNQQVTPKTDYKVANVALRC